MHLHIQHNGRIGIGLDLLLLRLKLMELKTISLYNWLEKIKSGDFFHT